MKVVINKCWGGFSLSKRAKREYVKRKNMKCKRGAEELCEWDIERSDPVLVSVVEELGEFANGEYARLRVVVVPDGVDWEVTEYDGMETVREKSRTFG